MFQDAIVRIYYGVPDNGAPRHGIRTVKGKFLKNERAEAMVRSQLQPRGITDSRVLEVMRAVPRHLFISGKHREMAYGDYPVSIGYEQTISQPYIVAYMTQALALRGNERVLEIGTGSGYQTAVLAELAAQVYTVEIVEPLLSYARRLLKALGYDNIAFRCGDGREGWAPEGPFDCIMVTAAAPVVPQALKDQLADNGIMAIPVGDYREYQELTVVRRLGKKYQIEETLGCRFVPLVDGRGAKGR
jgi:protein-L-isoaspartate(D-aspartate) O-methyltransferase